MTTRTSIRRLFARTPRSRRPAAARFRPRLEALEGRLVPATLTVTTLSDTMSHTGTSLRDALGAAVAGDIIQFQAGLSGPIDLSTAETGQGTLTLTQNVTIDGAGASITVEGGSTQGTATNAQPFVVNGGVTAALKNLTIRYGYESVAAGGLGGGIFNKGTLTVTNCTLAGNSAGGFGGGGGGGIENLGTLTVTNCTLSGNFAYNGGGGIDNGGRLATATVSDCTLAGNSTSLNGIGGGILNEGGSMMVSNSTLSANSASSGGGIESSTTLTLSNCTLSGNSATVSGGGIEAGGPLTVSNCTLSGNSATASLPGGAGPGGGGIFGDGNERVNNSIVANNSGGDIVGGYTGSHDLTGSVALGSLADNGGPTPTLALLPQDTAAIDQGGPDTTLSSPVDAATTSLSVADAAGLACTPGLTIRIDAEQMTITAVDGASNTFTVVRGVNGTSAVPHAAGAPLSPATDQRGFARQSGAAVDIGAFEVQQPSLSPATLASGTYGSPYSQTLTATEAPGGAGGPYTFAVTAGILPPGLSLASNGTLSGTPSAAGSFSVTITATDHGGYTASQAYAVVISPAPSVCALASSATSSPFGQSLTLTATVSAQPPGSGTPTGSVDFFDTSTQTDLGSVTLINGTAQLTTPLLSVGSHTIAARYSGDPNFLVSSGSISQTITGAAVNSALAASFNSTAIHAGSSVWFNSVLQVSGLGSSPVTIGLQQASISFTANGTSYQLAVPNAFLTYSPTATTATTHYDAGTNTWFTTLPSMGLKGNQFLDGLAFPVLSDLPGSISNVSWRGTLMTSAPGISLQWKWAAAVYTSWATDYNALGVKPVDGNKLSNYQNSDRAGTPETIKSSVTGGATGKGGSDYTGGYSGNAKVPLS